MKKILFLGMLFGLFACDDGDLQIEEIDFDTASIQTCDDLEDPTENTFFFKIDGDEALLLSLESGLIENQTSEAGSLTSTLPDASSLTYRFFNGDVTSAYFCDALPPVEPMVLEENTATAGDLVVVTRVDTLTALTKDYTHRIFITNYSITNSLGEELTDLSELFYGNFITSTENSASLEIPFSNYMEVAVTECTVNPIPDRLRLTKVINDEFIALDVPNADVIFANAVTPDTIPRTLDLADSEIFSYTVLDTEVGDDFACATTFGEDIRRWRLISTSGELNVDTTASAPDANGNVTYTHTITLVDMVLTVIGNGADISDVDLTVIPSAVFGTYTTVE